MFTLKKAAEAALGAVFGILILSDTPGVSLGGMSPYYIPGPGGIDHSPLSAWPDRGFDFGRPDGMMGQPAPMVQSAPIFQGRSFPVPGTVHGSAGYYVPYVQSYTPSDFNRSRAWESNASFLQHSLNRSHAFSQRMYDRNPTNGTKTTIYVYPY